jgi:hypothetical protein
MMLRSVGMLVTSVMWVPAPQTGMQAVAVAPVTGAWENVGALHCASCGVLNPPEGGGVMSLERRHRREVVSVGVDGEGRCGAPR